MRINNLCLTLLLSMLLLLFPSMSRAQGIAPVYFRYFPSSKIKNVQNPNVQDLSIQISQLVLRAGVPIPLGNRQSFILLGARYDLLLMDFSGSPVNRSPNKLHAPRFDLAFRHPLSPQWAFNWLFQPGLASDFRSSIGIDDLRLQGGFLAERRLKSNLVLGLGIGASTDFGQPLVLPIIQMSWIKPQVVALSLTLPTSLNINFLPGRSIELGFVANVSGNQYNLSRTDTKVKYSVLMLGPVANARVKGPFAVILDGGVALARRFKFDVDTIPNDFSLKNSPFLRVRLALRR